jgi:ABC-type bacteriocin/lantibiotic exporter with double-glycine peptidase domain
MNIFLEIWKNLNHRLKLKLILSLPALTIVYVLDFLSISLIIPLIATLGDAQSINGGIYQEYFNFFKNAFEILDINHVYFFSLLFCLGYIFASIFKYLISLYQYKLIKELGVYFSAKAFNKFISKNYLDHISQNSSELVSILLNKCGILITSTIQPFFSIVTSVIGVIIIITGLIYISPLKVILIITLLCIFYLILALIFKNKISKFGLEYNNSVTKIVRISQETSGGIREIIMSNLHSEVKKIFNEEVMRMYEATQKIDVIRSIPKYIIENISILILVFTILIIYSNDETNKIFIYAGFLALCLQRLIPLIQQIFIAWTSIRSSKSSVWDVLALLNHQSINIKDEEVQNFNSRIDLKKINYKYPNKTGFILKDINLSIKKGEKIGITGKTGSGKSTLLDIIVGLLEPSDGEIKIDEKIINRSQYSKWREKISYVPQNIFLLDDSVLKNIAYGIEGEKINYSRVEESAKIACIHESILEMENGYHTNLGERGSLISGGQRQRIGLARAIYRKNQILVLDEATSALDAETESKILENIFMLNKNLTVIIVSHSKNALSICEKIYLVSDGSVELLLNPSKKEIRD